jgi:phosphoglycolate phosphatase-like HAD superfamily hydrolase
MSVKVIIFDFDGTLADTLDAVVSITNRLAVEFGYKPTPPAELAKIRNLSSREIVQQSGIPIFKLPFLLKKLRAELQKEIHQLSPIPGVKEALTKLKHEGNVLGILTSNSEENVRIFLNQHGMEELFSFIYSEITLFSKQKTLKKVIKTNYLNPEDVIYVGDETRDIDASKKLHIKAVAVSWGFNLREALVKHNPDFLIHQPSELVEVIGSLQKIVS